MGSSTCLLTAASAVIFISGVYFCFPCLSKVALKLTLSWFLFCLWFLLMLYLTHFTWLAPSWLQPCLSCTKDASILAQQFHKMPSWKMENWVHITTSKSLFYTGATTVITYMKDEKPGQELRVSTLHGQLCPFCKQHSSPAAFLSTSGMGGLGFSVPSQWEHQGDDHCWFSDIMITGLKITHQ